MTRTDVGELLLRGDPGLLPAVREELERACVEGARRGEPTSIQGREAFVKYGPLQGKARWRHALRAHVLRRGLPRLREFENLEWLRAEGFHAPAPLLAGAFLRRGLPLFQFLYTEAVAAPTLRSVFEVGLPGLRGPALRALGRELARLHERGFVHRDLFPRNLLVQGSEGEQPRIVFLDAWRGGPGRGLRGYRYDLACLMVHGADLFSGPEQETLLWCYFDERPRLRNDAPEVLRRVARERNDLAARLRRKPRRTANVPSPSPEWIPPALRGRGPAPPPSGAHPA